MLKKIGFIVVLIGIMFALRPQLFLGLFRSSDSSTVSQTIPETPNRAIVDSVKKAQTRPDSKYKDPRRPSLIANNSKPSKGTIVESEDGITQYAPGYSEKDFGKAYEPEGLQPGGGEGQPSPGGIWDDLLTMKMKIEYDETIDDVVFVPQFNAGIRRHEGKTVEIKGYIIPNEIVANAMGGDVSKAGMFMLSAFPNQSCFFCGGAGPESVLEVYPKKPIPYSKETVTIKGRLELNDVDFLRMAFILKDAQIVE